MAKKKKKRDYTPDMADIISDLLEFAESVNLPDGFFDGDVQDECDSEAKLNAEAINQQSLMVQLEYLYEHGWEPARLKELMEESKAK
jgi:hypothetical protein